MSPRSDASGRSRCPAFEERVVKGAQIRVHLVCGRPAESPASPRLHRRPGEDDPVYALVAKRLPLLATARYFARAGGPTPSVMVLAEMDSAYRFWPTVLGLTGRPLAVIQMQSAESSLSASSCPSRTMPMT